MWYEGGGSYGKRKKHFKGSTGEGESNGVFDTWKLRWATGVEAMGPASGQGDRRKQWREVDRERWTGLSAVV